ncbi:MULTISPECIES: WhiB family transcriptional regulator [Streptosporangiaceae]|jgi:WhiB family transcriptional regulator, redox-sensing transcriptional regulator|uniref:Transcriptional regulator WhiB n=3 Tax=Streptosporangiaceae TaxID=2004 RepID=A0A8J3WRI6_9ACTN|nr:MULTISPECIES: WhiB family transcriptional regulator [Streptosporangiaceae]MBB5964356.1 WhiB family redox-sensing transcriptional regulator [Planomonospora venezuelensis]MBG0830875.1 WhiB family transcriptional regulator [Planomonospora sp. ID67723]GIH90768.1 transcriptional regulator WhiD [Planobispora siamensis]GIH99709.1 transcriptional regulator WhiD [Planobispora takensis]GIN05104.1 transcriptional regulator WhiD [Planomonospora venezuelensis]
MSQVRRQTARPRPSWGWQDDAACRGEDLVLFFGPDGERQPERDIRERKAKAICGQCPVRAECLDYALSRPEKYGTWGGLNEDERASERRRRMRRAASAGISAVA